MRIAFEDYRPFVYQTQLWGYGLITGSTNSITPAHIYDPYGCWLRARIEDIPVVEKLEEATGVVRKPEWD